jgi:phosphomannomutase/phosphoglucomutase
MNENIFRAYDIRGIYGKDLTLEAAEKIGKAFGSFLGKGKKVVVGMDIRLSSKNLKSALISGLTCVGCNVVDIGIVPTPVFYFAVKHKGFDGGTMITASHNPPEWNGFQLCEKDGLPVAQNSGIEKIKELALKNKFKKVKKGKFEVYDEILRDYSNFISSKIKIKRGLKVVLDCSNGTAGLVLPSLLEKNGCEVIRLNCKPDGRFPSHLPEPREEFMNELKEKVVGEKADLGVCYDGDADRCVFVDEGGEVLPSNKTAMIFIDEIFKKIESPKILYDVTCSAVVEEFIKKNGGVGIVSSVGHSFFIRKMVEMGLNFGFERSSHYYFAETFGFSDAIFATLKMVEILSKSKKRLSEISKSLPHYPFREENVKCDDSIKFEVVKSLKEKFVDLGYKVILIDGVKAYDGEKWVLVRASNTEPLIRIVAEGREEEKMEEVFKLGIGLLKEEIEKHEKIKLKSKIKQ